MPLDLKAHTTRLLRAAAGGDGQATEDVFPLVYEELKQLAVARMARERRGHTLQATALVHEVYLRLVDDSLAWDGRSHFYAAAAEAMRRILIEHARKRGAAKRGGNWNRRVLSVLDLADEDGFVELLQLDDALTALEEHDARAAKVVELRFYAGLGAPEVATALGVSESTVARDWAYARGWLFRQLERQD